MKRLHFLREYIKDIRRVGAVAPSSRYLARKMVRDIDFAKAKVIVEYGPGTGVFTGEIMRRMQQGTKLLIMETNEAFYKKLCAEYRGNKDVIVVNESAEYVVMVLKKHGISKPDYIVSGLPFAAFPAEVSHAILLATAKILGSKGVFITFQYTLVKRKLLAKYFGTITTTREMRNVPPAYVLSCRV